ncbi:MAG: hypothetical protein ACP5I7_03610 [Sulfolobales archaeon]|jgi:hypothetical protein
MPRRKKSKEVAEEETEKKEVSKKDTKSSGRGKRSVRATKKSSFDLDQWVEEKFDDLINNLQIRYLGLDPELQKFIAKKVVEILWDEDKKPDMERLSSRIRRNIDKIRSLISQIILESGVEINQEQLEFIASSEGPWILGYAPLLYKYATKFGREDLISNLRYQWVKWWSLSRDPEIPPECPRCKFNSLMPDGTCMVCGYSPSPSELLSYYKFDDYINNLVRRNDLAKLKTILSKGYVLISSLGIKLPDEERSKYDLEVHLTRSYREKILDILQRIELKH